MNYAPCALNQNTKQVRKENRRLQSVENCLYGVTFNRKSYLYQFVVPVKTNANRRMTFEHSNDNKQNILNGHAV